MAQRRRDNRTTSLGIPIAHIYRGRARLNLVKELALGEWSPRELAEQIGIDQADIREFSDEFQDEIAEVRQALANNLAIESSTAGLWITSKVKRLAELQQAAEDIGEVLTQLHDEGIDWSRSHRDMHRARLDIFRQVADEMGAYPQRQAAPIRQGTTVHYVIESEDTGAMT
jgi:Trp operon repressor